MCDVFSQTVGLKEAIKKKTILLFQCSIMQFTWRPTNMLFLPAT